MSRIPSKIVSSLLLGAMILTLSACGNSSDESSAEMSTENTAVSTETIAEEEYLYYEGADLGGEIFTVYNVPKDLWNMLCVIVPEEQTGEAVNDAIFTRNELVKEKLNCDIKEINDPWEEWGNSILSNFTNAVLSGEDTYDAFYMPMHFMLSGLTSGYYTNLNSIDTLHLEEDYWDQVMLESTSIGGNNYFATSPAQLMSYDGIWCIFFNEAMMDDLGLEYPYETVKNGDWTLDELRTYSEAAANLNGADTFVMDGNSPAIYGFTSFSHVTSKFIYGFDVNYVSKDASDYPVFSAASEEFITAVEKLNEYFSTEGEFLMSQDESFTETSYIKYFRDQKALFLGAELKAAQQLRDIEESFGILPYPKLDESQENYASTAVHQCAAFTIPVTNTEAEKVGLLFDALSYESARTVVDVYYSHRVEHKGLRNEESIEMLEIIQAARSFDIGITYQWVAGLESSLIEILTQSNPPIASTVESSRSQIETNIKEMLGGIS